AGGAQQQPETVLRRQGERGRGQAPTGGVDAVGGGHRSALQTVDAGDGLAAVAVGVGAGAGLGSRAVVVRAAGAALGADQPVDGPAAAAQALVDLGFGVDLDDGQRDLQGWDGCRSAATARTATGAGTAWVTGWEAAAVQPGGQRGGGL